MLKQFQYKLPSPEQEQAFLASRLHADKRKMGRVYWLALCIVSTFLVIGLAILPPTLDARIISFVRGAGVAVALLGLLTLRRTENRRTFEWIAFGCLGWLVVQFEIVQLLSFANSETLLAWNVFVAFLIYLTVPISLRFRLICVLFLSAASTGAWLYNKEGSFDLINCIGVVSVFLAANIFGAICAVHAERTERDEFELFESEKRLKANLETAFAQLKESVESRNKIYRVLAHDLRAGIGALGSIGHIPRGG